MKKIMIRTIKLKQLIFMAVAVILCVIILGLLMSLIFSGSSSGTPKNNEPIIEEQLLDEETALVFAPISAQDILTSAVPSAAETVSSATWVDRLSSWINDRFLNPPVFFAYALPSVKGVTVELASAETHTADTLTPETEFESYYDNSVSEEIRIEVNQLKQTTPEKIPSLALGGGPSVLIYHTHTNEAYTQTDADQYKQSDEWRTTDNTKNVAAVGDLLAKELNDKYGISVVHDTTDHEPPLLKTAYARSLKTMQKNKEKYPTLQMFIDVHRDAYDTLKKSDSVMVDGKSCAKVMFVVGTGENSAKNGELPRPNWQANFQLAQSITNQINKDAPGLGKAVRVKSNRYNQHVSDMCVLIEVGHNGNTLQEARNSIPYIAKAIAAVVK